MFNFQIPYLLCLLLLGLPLFFMEMALGQYSGTSCTKVASGQPVTVLEVVLGVSSTCPWPEGSWLWDHSCAHHDDLLLHSHHGLGTLLPLHGKTNTKESYLILHKNSNKGFRSTLPWQSCQSSVLADYATSNCFTKFDNDLCSEVGST